MAKELLEEREALFQMICSLRSEDIQKVVSYVSFLRFVDVYKDKAMADLLKIELAKDDSPKIALNDSPQDTVDEFLPPSLPVEDVSVFDDMKAEPMEPEAVKPYEPVEPIIEPFIEDVHRYKKLKEELLHKIEVEDESIFQKNEDSTAQQTHKEEPPRYEFMSDPMHLEPEEDTSNKELDKDSMSGKFYGPMGSEIKAKPDVPIFAPYSSGFNRDDEHFYTPVRSDYFDSGERPTPNKKPEPKMEPQTVEALSLETSPKEIFIQDEPMLEPAQPENIQSDLTEENSSVDEEPFLQETTSVQDSHGQKLRQVVKSLRLGFADVAYLFQISLPMARTLFTGVTMGPEEEMQLQYLLEVAERVEEIGISRFDQESRRPMPNGEFFMEKLKNREISEENLKSIQKAAERTEELRRKFKGATKPFHDMQNAIGLYATPLHCEG